MRQLFGIFDRIFKVSMATVLLVPALAVSAMATDTKQLHYAITDLGALGGFASYGQSINDFGQVTGYYWNYLAPPYEEPRPHTFLYSEWTGMQDLGELPESSGSYGYGINNFGQATGVSGADEDATTHAFLYIPGIGMTDIGILPNYYYSSGNAINDFGQITGDVETTSNPTQHAFLYTSKTGMQDIGTLGGSNSNGLGINDLGQVTGYSSITGNSTNHAFLYSPKTGMRDIGTLPGGSYSEGSAINNLGQVTGYSGIAGNSTYHAFLYSPKTGMRDIGTLPGGSYSEGCAINDLGQVTGHSYYSGTGLPVNHAFLYSAGEMFDLNALLPPSSGWTLQSGQGINDLGQITGFGTVNGQTHAFLMTPVH